MNEELKVIISAEISKLKKGVDDAKSHMKSFKEQVQAASKDVDSKFKAMGSSIASGLKAGATAMAGITTALVGLAATTTEYRNEQAKLVSAFETAGASAETAKTTYNDLYRVLGDGGQATEAANHLAKLTTSQEALNEWTTICQGAYATFGDSLPIESLTEAANETAKTGALTGGLADALNWAGVSEEAFQAQLEACNSEAEREALIRETLTGLYGDAAAAYETNNAQILAQNEAQASLQENLAVLGETLQPVITAFTAFASEALAVVMPYLQDMAASVVPALQVALSGAADVIGKIMGFISEHWEIIVGIAAVIGGIATAIGIYNVVAAVKAAMDAAQVTTLGALAAAYIAQAAAMAVAIAPYVLIVAAIAAVIAIIVLCIKHWDEIKAAVANAWEWIKEKTSAAVEAVVNFFTNLKERATEIVNNILGAIKDKFNQIKENMSQKIQEAKAFVEEKYNQLKDKVTEVTTKMKDKIVEIYEQKKQKTAEKLDEMKEYTEKVYNEMKEIMSNVMQAAKETVQEKLDNVKQAYHENGGGVKGIVNASMEAIKGYYSAGHTFINKLTGGKLTELATTFKTKMNEAKTAVSNILDNIKKKFTDIMEGAKSIVSGAIEKIKSFFNFKWSLPHISLPHFSISGDFSLNPPSVPSFHLSWYQFGGVFDSPHLFPWAGGIGGLGENGAEAIVPLEKNTQWLDKIADKLAARQGSTPIVLTVDGKTFAQVAVDSINDLTAQTGSLPLKFA